MSENELQEHENENDTKDNPEYSELKILKERATLLGIKYSPNISLDTLKERVNNKLSTDADIKEVKDSTKPDPDKAKIISDMQRKKLKINEMTALTRCMVVCNNPNKKESTGDIITAGNSLNMVKKFIPFNVEWEIPNVILNAMKEKKCQVFYSTKEKGVSITRPRLIPEYTISILPQLTKEELEELKVQQALSGSIDK